MNQELKTKWLEALRSGKYKQGRGNLHNTKNEFCCLGVLCDVVDSNKWVKRFGNGTLLADSFVYDGYWAFLPDDLKNEIGGVTAENKLQAMNDNEKRSFNEIADFIDKNL